MNDHGVCVFSINDAGMLQSLHEYVSMSTYVRFMSSLTNRKSDCYFWTRLDWNRKNRVTDRRGGVRKHHNTHTHILIVASWSMLSFNQIWLTPDKLQDVQ